MQDDSDDSPLDFPRLLHDAISQAVAHEDPERFMAWFREHLADYQTESSDGEWLDAPFTAVLGRSIWNALPLPGNGFKPQPLPEPGRNDLCFCGSGVKYKRCCAGSPMLPLDPDAILATVLDQMAPESLAPHLGSSRVPVQKIVELASLRFHRGELWNAVTVLEPLFAGELRSTDEHYGAAMDLLCDLYFELGHTRKKEQLLQRIVDNAKRSPLRSDAWQRIAVARLDHDDIDGAWEAFHQAQKDHPDAPSIGLLEIQLLMSRGQAEETRERAGFWEKRLRRQGHGDDDRLVQFFGRVTRNPRGVMADMGVKAADGAGGPLMEWLQKVAARPLPDYGAAAAADALPEADGPSTSGQPDQAPTAPLNAFWLVPPTTLSVLEDRWREDFPLDKPFSIQDDPSLPDNPWEPGLERQWMAFLDSHPEAFDSLDILDDLATALVRHGQFGADWLDHSILDPLLARAEAIVEHALRDRHEPRLPWYFNENRPALRSLTRRIYLKLRRGDDEGAARAAERMLALNPHDNHGFRGSVTDHRLRQGDDEGALAITEQYPQDTNPECAYGRVLALYRLERLDEAQTALCEALEYLPRVLQYLTIRHTEKPGLHPDHVTVGGDDQAWLYREAMGDVWRESPGALDWLETAAKRC